ANLRTSRLTYRDLLALPTSERALDDRLTKLLPPAGGASLAREKVEAVAELLGGNPTRPAARAALYRVLAGLRGLELQGPVRDPYGQRGLGLAVRDAAGKTVVIVDPASAAVLGLERITLRRLPYVDARPGSVISERWYLDARVVAGFGGHLTRRVCPATGSGFGCWLWSR